MTKFFFRIIEFLKSYPNLFLKLNEIKVINGKILSEIVKKNISTNINDYEFKIFSQFGEDGIIQYLVDNLDISCKKFIEFGVENYEEANTRFILENNNWAGLVIDCSEQNIDFIKKQNYYWKYNLTAINDFVKTDNINQILKNNNFDGNVGILSIDIDGNDYWILDAIQVATPDIIIVEYNANFGFKKSITIKYQENFDRNQNIGTSKLIYGCSLKALVNLCEKKGYSLVCTNSNGNNSFFVKNNLLNSKVKKIKIEDAFHFNSFKELINEKKIPVKVDNLEEVLNSKDLVEV